MQSNPGSSTSRSLLERVKSNDADAWTRLVTLYAPLIYRWARQAGLQDHDAADVGQEVFRTVIQRVSEFHRDRPGDTFRGWLWWITRNKLGDRFRCLANEPRPVGGTGAHEQIEQVAAGLPQEPDTDAQFDPERSLLHRTLALLQREFECTTWQAFWRVVVDGQSATDVAAELGMTAGAVRQAKYRVLARLRCESSDL
ncbi:MAG: sigma-70 family RNA polymerase sigma factor [Pirellulales bacterium]|nr:sigma-70 family RNA polymerase sigma factor [Pirellulales bacterium]